jgi:hypothetical protein
MERVPVCTPSLPWDMVGRFTNKEARDDPGVSQPWRLSPPWREGQLALEADYQYNYHEFASNHSTVQPNVGRKQTLVAAGRGADHLTLPGCAYYIAEETRVSVI